MEINGKHIHVIDVRLDQFTVLHIAEHRIDDCVAIVAECCRQFQDTRYFSTTDELCDHYHVNNNDLRDTIARIVDAIDGKL